MKSNINFQVSIPQENDTEQELYRVSSDLLLQIHKSGLEVTRYQGSDASLPSKGLPLDINTLLVALASAGAFNVLIQAIKEWGLKNEGRRIRLKLQMKNKTLELDYLPADISNKELLEFTKKLTKIIDEA